MRAVLLFLLVAAFGCGKEEPKKANPLELAAKAQLAQKALNDYLAESTKYKRPVADDQWRGDEGFPP